MRISDWSSDVCSSDLAHDDAPLLMVLGMLANKDAAGFLKPFAGLLTAVYPVPVPGHEHHSPQELARAAKAHRIPAVSSADGPYALKRIARAADTAGQQIGSESRRERGWQHR